MQKEKSGISIKKAAALNAGAKYISVAIQLIYTVVLSRILSPTEFGIVAVINVFIVFFQLFADMGVGTAVIQNKTLTKNEINDIFTFTVYLGIGLMVLFIIASFPISLIYENQIYIPLGIVLSFSLLFNALNMIPNAVLLRDKRFVAIAVRSVSAALISVIATIAVALAGAGVYALAVHSVINALVLFIWNVISTQLKFEGRPNFDSIKKVWGYSIWQFAAQTLNYFNRNLDNLLVGKCFSTEDLGYYNKAYSMISYPIVYLPGVITPVMHPILSEHQEEKEYIYNSYLKILKFLSLLGCFGASYCFFAGREIMLIAFGSRWEVSIRPFQILSLSLWGQMLTNTIAPIYQSLGNTKLMFKSTIYTTALIVSSIIVGVVLGNITTVAICVSVGYVLNFIITFTVLTKRAFHTSFLKFIVYFRHEYLIFALLIATALLWPISIHNLLISLAVKTGVYFGLYIILLIITRQAKALVTLFKCT